MTFSINIFFFSKNMKNGHKMDQIWSKFKNSHTKMYSFSRWFQISYKFWLIPGILGQRIIFRHFQNFDIFFTKKKRTTVFLIWRRVHYQFSMNSLVLLLPLRQFGKIGKLVLWLRCSFTVWEAQVRILVIARFLLDQLSKKSS